MSDEKFEEFLQREAQAYNTPPAAVPRDEMWSVINGTPQKKNHWIRHAPWIGLAATLLIGVGIGRFMLTRDTLPADITPAPRMVAAGNSEIEPVPARNSARPAARNATRTNTSAASRVLNEDANGVDATTTPYRVVSQRHLASAEALISVVTTGPRDAMMDSLTSRWAREMLGNTRLLLDSPAGEDPLRRRLLEDLETLLVQLVQRSGAAVDERDLIDRTLQRTQLLTRLRTNSAGT